MALLCVSVFSYLRHQFCLHTLPFCFFTSSVWFYDRLASHLHSLHTCCYYSCLLLSAHHISLLTFHNVDLSFIFHRASVSTSADANYCSWRLLLAVWRSCSPSQTGSLISAIRQIFIPFIPSRNAGLGGRTRARRGSQPLLGLQNVGRLYPFGLHILAQGNRLSRHGLQSGVGERLQTLAPLASLVDGWTLVIQDILFIFHLWIIVNERYFIFCSGNLLFFFLVGGFSRKKSVPFFFLI